jgi:hypothetical protein
MLISDQGLGFSDLFLTFLREVETKTFTIILRIQSKNETK